MTTLLIVLLALTAVAYHLGRRRALTVSGSRIANLHSLPRYYGLLTALWCAIPALVVLTIWIAFESSVITSLVIADLPEHMRDLPQGQLGLLVNDIKNIVNGNIASGKSDELNAAAAHYAHLKTISNVALAVIALTVAIFFLARVRGKITAKLRARNRVEKIIHWLLIACSSIAILTTIGIVLSVLFESLRFFEKVPISEFLFGTTWSPQTAIRSDQVGSSGAFGAVPLFVGTMLISLVAMLVAAPIGLFSAVYLAEYASRRVRSIAKPLLEILAGIPTVVYGFFAALTVAPMLREGGSMVGLNVSSESALAAGGVMGMMLIPFVSSLSDDVINAVPQSLRDWSYGLGATKSETITKVLLPAALPGIVGALLLAVSRAIGETMIVVMAAGLAANLTANPRETVTTVTVQIVTLLVGDQEFDSAKTLAAFALGLLLFLVTLALNVVALQVVKRYREQYE